MARQALGVAWLPSREKDSDRQMQKLRLVLQVQSRSRRTRQIRAQANSPLDSAESESAFMMDAPLLLAVRPHHEIRRHQAQRRPDPSARLAVCRITAFAEVSYCEYPSNEWQPEGIKSRKVIATVSFLCSRVECLRTYRGAQPLHVD